MTLDAETASASTYAAADSGALVMPGMTSGSLTASTCHRQSGHIEVTRAGMRLPTSWGADDNRLRGNTGHGHDGPGHQVRVVDHRNVSDAGQEHPRSAGQAFACRPAVRRGRS